MALIRFQLDLAIPKNVFDTIPLAKKEAGYVKLADAQRHTLETCKEGK